MTVTRLNPIYNNLDFYSRVSVLTMAAQGRL